LAASGFDGSPAMSLAFDFLERLARVPEGIDARRDAAIDR